MQLKLDFGGGIEPQPGQASGPAGWLTGRAWQRAAVPDEGVVARLRRELPLARPVSDRLLEILASRGCTDGPSLERFFYPSLDHVHDPFLLEEMDVAVARVRAAAAGQERVAVHGDFDVDGITGCALVWLILQALKVDGARARALAPFVPDRARDGYGVCARQVREWAEAGVGLMLTVDTGSAARAEIAFARERGMETIVLDHHLFRTRPDAVAVVNPRRIPSRYPNPDLCGVAVAFKLAQALRRADPACLPPDFETDALDLVALGLVADQMPLTGENRTLAHRGLALMRESATRRPGLSALMQVAGVDSRFLNAAAVAYQMAPRLNACGRVGDAGTALRLLLAGQPREAAALAREADRANADRRAKDQLVKDEAVAMAAPFVARGDAGLVLAAPGWHKGVIGISASRLVELYARPAVLIAIEGDEARGSARSVAGVDVKAVLDRCAPLLVRWGGHAQAAGLTLLSEDVDRFREAFLKALSQAPAGGPPAEPWDLDLPLTDLKAGDVTDLVSEFELLEPYGQGHREPVFRCGGLRLAGQPQPLGNGDHLRFWFRAVAPPAATGGLALERDFVAFGSARAWEAARDADDDLLLERRWEILFRLGRNSWRPRGGGTPDPVQQQLVDLRPSPAP